MLLAPKGKGLPSRAQKDPTVSNAAQVLPALVRRRHSPFRDAFVGSDDGGLDVYRVVPHSAQLHGFIQGSHHVQSVVTLCGGNEVYVRVTEKLLKPLKIKMTVE